MKYLKILIILFVFQISSLYGQQNITWLEIYGGTLADAPRDILQTPDGGYIFTGYTHSNDHDVSGNNGERDIWVVKLTNQKEIEWQKCIGGSDWDQGIKIISLDDNSFMILGVTKSSDGDISGNHGGYDGLLIKLDLDGNILWQTCYGGEGHDYFSDISQTSDGGCIIVGSSRSDFIDGISTENNGSSDCWIVKLDNLGSIEWFKIYGGHHEDAMRNIIETDDGGYIVAGSTWSNDGDIIGFKGGTDGWILKLDDIGNIEWNKCYGGSGMDRISSIIKLNNSYLLTGHSDSEDGDITNNLGGNDVWVIEIDNDGNIEWQKCYGGTGGELSSKILQTIDDNFIIVGSTNSWNGDVAGQHGQFDFWVFKIDHQHNIIWQRCIGGWGADRGYDILETEENVYTIIGTTKSFEGDIPFNYGYRDDICLLEISEHVTVVPIGSVGVIITILLILGAVIIRRVG